MTSNEYWLFFFFFSLPVLRGCLTVFIVSVISVISVKATVKATGMQIIAKEERVSTTTVASLLSSDPEVTEQKKKKALFIFLPFCLENNGKGYTP